MVWESLVLHRSYFTKRPDNLRCLRIIHLLPMISTELFLTTIHTARDLLMTSSRLGVSRNFKPIQISPWKFSRCVMWRSWREDCPNWQGWTALDVDLSGHQIIERLYFEALLCDVIIQRCPTTFTYLSYIAILQNPMERFTFFSRVSWHTQVRNQVKQDWLWRPRPLHRSF